jgi:hypothetical protein
MLGTWFSSAKRSRTRGGSSEGECKSCCANGSINAFAQELQKQKIQMLMQVQALVLAFTEPLLGPGACSTQMLTALCDASDTATDRS